MFGLICQVVTPGEKYNCLVVLVTMAKNITALEVCCQYISFFISLLVFFGRPLRLWLACATHFMYDALLV